MVEDGSLGHLIEYWLGNNSEMSTRDLAVLLLETIRDDISRATTKDGSPVASASQVRQYLREQVVALCSPPKQSR